ncbi:MAG: hypothetical protein P9L94_17055 [Candidatus Hinthialibacter antarcticus]|nr:hypothetical protein [Candidatus Hinthialibacter antarcticus]
MERTMKKYLIALAVFVGAFLFLGLTSAVYLLYQTALPNFKNAQFRAKIVRANADIRMLSHGLDAFWLDSNKYPIADKSRWIENAGVMIDGYPNLANLTSPIGYLVNYPIDPLDQDKKGYRYFSDGNTFYIIVSNGPDEDIDIDERLFKGDVAPFQPLIYNPSNGLISDGDIFYTNQGNPLKPEDRPSPPLAPPAPVEIKEATSAN